VSGPQVWQRRDSAMAPLDPGTALCTTFDYDCAICLSLLLKPVVVRRPYCCANPTHTCKSGPREIRISLLEETEAISHG